MQKLKLIGSIHDGIEIVHIPLEELYIGKKSKAFWEWKHCLFKNDSSVKVNYTIYKQMGDWIATYVVTISELVSVSISWVGKTPEEALKNLQNIMLKLKNGVWD